MLKASQSRVDRAKDPDAALRAFQIAAEADRRDVEARVAAMHQQMLAERRAKSYRNLASFWPLALGVAISFYAPVLRDAAAAYAPWAAKLLFSLSALVAQHEVRLGRALPPLSEMMLYAQFPLDGLLVTALLRKRSHILSVCAQVILFHAVFLICLGLAAGSFDGIFTNQGVSN